MSVRLRPLAREDGARVLAWRNSEEVARWMYGDHAISAPHHTAWLEAVLAARAAPQPDRLYWIVELEGAPVGVANFAHIDRANAKADWAYYLADPAVRGKGVGAAVEYAMLSHAFGPLALNKLWCEVLVENAAVIALHESFGFQREALFRRHVRKVGLWRDVAGLGLLSEEWALVEPASRARIEAKGREPATLSP